MTRSTAVFLALISCALLPQALAVSKNGVGLRSSLSVNDEEWARRHAAWRQYTETALLEEEEMSEDKLKAKFFEYCKISCQHAGKPNLKECKCDCEGSGRWGGQLCEICEHRCLNDGKLLWDTCECKCAPPYIGLKCETCPLICKNGKLRDDSCVCDCGLTHWEGRLCDVCGQVCERGTINRDTCHCEDCGGSWGGPSCDTCLITECPVKGQGLDAAGCQCIRLEDNKTYSVNENSEKAALDELDAESNLSESEKLKIKLVQTEKDEAALRDQVNALKDQARKLEEQGRNAEAAGAAHGERDSALQGVDTRGVDVQAVEDPAHEQGGADG